MPALTIGMPTYQDFDGVYFTLQALRLYQDLDDVELLVVDNYGCEHTKDLVEGWAKGRYFRATDLVGTAPAKELVFREARGEAVLCCDSHVLFAPGVIARLKAFYRDHPECADLLQGPLVYDDLQSISTHFDPVWRGQMWGVWATDPRGLDPEAEPFEIPMQGMGAFSCRRAVWPGFNARFRGFGGEEGYIHEKFRQAGGRTLCLPWLRWTHRFGRPGGVPYPLYVEDKFRNYLIGHAELGLDLAAIVEHFAESLSPEAIASITAEAVGVTFIAAPPPAAAAPIAAGGDDASPEDRPGTGLPPGAKSATAAENSAGPLTSPVAPESGRPPALGSTSPAVSCICPTYGRPELLEETIQSFLQQEYSGPKELIILNDFDRQILAFDHPEVTIVNVHRRFRTLGEKYNAAVALASYDLLFVWEDDDIYLPHRLSFSVERFDTRKGFFKPDRAWIWNEGRISGPESNLFHAGSCWSRELFERARGYAPMGVGHDVEMEARFDQVSPGCTSIYEIRPEEIYYVYRWGGTGSYHGSGFSRDQHRAVAEFVQEQVRLGKLRVGQIALAPRWKADYVAQVREHLAGFSAPAPPLAAAG